jgi:O-antigen/teichoic acid export membrane protein
MLVFSTVLATLAALAMPFAVRLIFGAAFAPVTPIAIAFLPGFVALAVVTIASQYLAALGYPRAVTVNWLLATLVLAVASAVLVPLDDARGAALASSAAYGVLALLMLLSARKLLRSAERSQRSIEPTAGE